MRWQVLRLDDFERDVADLVARHALDRDRLDADLDAAFTDPYKAARIDKLLTSGTRSSAVDRLAGSGFPPSVRLHLLHDPWAISESMCY